MHRIADGLWDFETQIKFAGVGMPVRTVVIQLGNGGLVVHSPGRLDDEIREALGGLGPVVALIAPNRFHHLFVDAWRDAYPDAALHVASGLASKRADLGGHVLTDTAPALWAGEVEQHVWGGIPGIGEVVFLHKPSRTLLNTDMMHNMQNEPRWFARTAWRLLGAYGRFGPSRMERWMTKDRHALRESIDTVLSWDFDRVTVAHGEIVETDAKDGVRDGWSWVPPR